MAPGHKKAKKSQTRLRLEPVAQSSSPNRGYNPGLSPANVRFSGRRTSPSSRSSPSATKLTSKAAPHSSQHARSSQSKLNTANPAPRPPSFMPRSQGKQRQALTESSDDSAAEIGDGSEDEADVDEPPAFHKTVNPKARYLTDSDSDDQPIVIRPPRSSQSVSTKLQRTVLDDDHPDEDEESEGPVAPGSSLKRKRPVTDLGDTSEDDEEGAPGKAYSTSLKRLRPTMVELSDTSEDEIIFSTKKRKLRPSSSIPTEEAGPSGTPGRLKRGPPRSSSPVKKLAHRGHRSAKQKNKELLSRRRAGEKISKLTSSESESDEDGAKRGIYDTDSENGLQALKEFDDDEPEEEKAAKPPKRKEKKKKRKTKGGSEEGEDDLDDFVIDDDDAPLGAPDISIPLEFTAQAHRPLKDQFPHAVEWLVHNRINPAFERKDPVYLNAWRKLNDEVAGLASSKFASAAWKPDFHRALRARPKLEAFELGHGHGSGLNEGTTCEACGRSGHPASWMIKFDGTPYHKDTLAEVESDSDSDSDGSDGSNVSRDTSGASIPPTSKEWYVGVVCASNAETAHSLIHWKAALKTWVESRLESEGWMSAAKLKEREKMKPKHRRRQADRIVDEWSSKGVVSALFADFKKTLEEARNKSTTAKGPRGRR
ncbi:hypothetical protein F5Y15DRAFT_388523 [Xylariaceae sp. FL0016]|nr:hypothetical protein F5Y15DRAFT_388523 [Xylariaceae sp. FL0016]